MLQLDDCWSVDVDDALLEGLGQYQQLLEECLVSKRNAIVRNVRLVNVVTDRSILRVVAAQPVLLLLRTRNARYETMI